MKILVFSDSHGDSAYMRAALRAHRGDTDLVYFLGDGIRDFANAMADFPSTPHIVISGNNDSAIAAVAAGMEAVSRDARTIDGVRILAVHGHSERVKWGHESLICKAAETGADLVLFGHTHTPENRCVTVPFESERRIHLFNPGAVGPSLAHTYGVIYVISGKISADHGYAKL